LVEEWFSFFQVPAKTDDVKVLLISVTLSIGSIELYAQEVTLPPIVVTGTFELRQGPSVTDLFTQHLLRQMEAKRVLEEATARSLIFNARFWSYIPMKLESSSSDSSLFFTPSYLTTDYRNAERALQESRKQSLFDGR
jgi:hypothetical protein